MKQKYIFHKRIQSGEKLRITSKGYKDREGSKGDLVAEVKIVVPKKIYQKKKNLYMKNYNKYHLLIQEKIIYQIKK